jgi:hypothetical protein
MSDIMDYDPDESWDQSNAYIAELESVVESLGDAATALYAAGCWRIHNTPIGTRAEDELWKDLRNAIRARAALDEGK